MKEATDKTRKYLEQSEACLFWSLSIIRELCKHDHNLAIQWAAECIRIRLSECEPEQITKLDKYIQQALDEQNISVSECVEIGRTIWYLKPGRNRSQTAVARLWWALGDFSADNKDRGIREINSAIWLVSTEDELVSLDRLKRRYINNYRLSELYIEAALKIYNEYQAKKS
ncbi:conserved hypothetical protein [Hyella patelloides LEGE 07179]|uniref:Uncharacterized protein n=1 Tax=Hyella patelloides LEGE 07179 TaxID=945734 RepID=A0A563W1D4_9CYAN|nr:hypothetical protein [Hyella patelloides]VEP17512.1 conserved hypothetical protein [Hyella patelloides LEGE 07179]